MQFGDALHDCQTKTASFGARFAATVEALDEPWQVFLGDARTVVGDAKGEFAVAPAREDGDRRTRRRWLESLASRMGSLQHLAWKMFAGPSAGQSGPLIIARAN